MKSLVMAIVALASITASAKYVTVRVCDSGESSQECRTVTYKVRAHKEVTAPVEICSAEGTQCVPSVYGVPAWLQALSDAFANHSSPADQNAGSAGGPN